MSHEFQLTVFSDLLKSLLYHYRTIQSKSEISPRSPRIITYVIHGLAGCSSDAQEACSRPHAGLDHHLRPHHRSHRSGRIGIRIRDFRTSHPHPIQHHGHLVSSALARIHRTLVKGQNNQHPNLHHLADRHRDNRCRWHPRLQGNDAVMDCSLALVDPDHSKNSEFSARDFS